MAVMACAMAFVACDENTTKSETTENNEEMKQQPIPGTDGNKYLPYEQRTGEEAIVYFTRDLSAEGLIKAYEQVNGKIEGKEKVGTIIGNIGKDMNLSRNYYLNPAVLETSQCGVCTLAYPVTESHPEGVTINYDLSGDGVIYNDVLYYPAKTLRFTVDYTMTNDENVSIEVNGTKLGMGPDTYSYTIDPAKATAYEINVKAVSTAMAGTGTEADPYMIKSDDD